MESFPAHSFKVCVLGDSYAGKSMMIECLRQGGNKVPENAFPNATVAQDIYPYNVKMQGKSITLQIWDTAGQERFQSIAQLSMRGARVVLLVYDITDCTSFQSITNWFLQAKDCVHRNAIFILVGNKADLHENRKVTQNTAHTFARSHDWDYFETSALQGQNILFLFDQIAKGLISQINVDDEIDKTAPRSIILESPSYTERKCCC